MSRNARNNENDEISQSRRFERTSSRGGYHKSGKFDVALCSSRKYPYPPHERSMEIPRGCEIMRAKILKECIGLNWNFQRGGGLNQKTFRLRGSDILWNNTFR